jgi:hypothetical protein
MNRNVLTVPYEFQRNGKTETRFRRVGAIFENARRETGEVFLSVSSTSPSRSPSSSPSRPGRTTTPRPTTRSPDGPAGGRLAARSPSGRWRFRHKGIGPFAPPAQRRRSPTAIMMSCGQAGGSTGLPARSPPPRRFCRE